MIRDEALVRERKYLCEIILAVPGSGKAAKVPVKNIDSDDIDLEISPILFIKNDPLLVEFIENKIRIESGVHAAIEAGAVKDKAEKLQRSEERIKMLYELRRGVI